MSSGVEGPGSNLLPQSERYKMNKQIRQQQVENYLQFITTEEKDHAGMTKDKKDKKNKEKEKDKKKKKKSEGAKEKRGVKFKRELCLQSYVEELDEKQVMAAIKEGADLNFIIGNGVSLLHKACVEGSPQMVELLLKGGANVNCQDDDWWTPLHAACYQDNVETVQLLLQAGANPTLLDIDGNFALDHCVKDTESWALVIQRMEQLGVTSEKMRKLRSEQIRRLENEVKTSVQLAADIDRPLFDGVTVLHIASANGFVRLVHNLLKKGANVAVVDNAGFTPLHCAAKFGQVRTTEILISHGADVGAKDYQGNRVIDVTSCEQIQTMLLSSGVQNRRTVTSLVSGNTGSDDEADDGGYETPADMGSITSKMLYSPQTPMSKADRLSEARRLQDTHTSPTEEEDEAGQETEDKNKNKMEDGESGAARDEEDEDIYYSCIWAAAESSEMVQLPERVTNDDLTELAVMDEMAILNAVIDRYTDKRIYTYVGDILIAVN
ncbi:unconventional myosin-XVI, partial [Aplysia californica]|uniref:Unconventional myosin-XVI n=1 Tax=Aplysia californica TaxID=6500 RepID=A0ABM1A8R2_APLCA